MNPEFRRNIWQELSLQRLVAMPAILLAIFSIDYLKNGVLVIPHTALLVLFLLLVIWGAGLAADAIFEEIRDHTWDAQRMTPLGPWSMTWGKLFGSTIFVWYGALWCLIAVFWAARQTPDLYLAGYSSIAHNSIYYILIGIFTQSLALFTAILFQRISPLRSRAKVVLIQLFAMTVGTMFFLITTNTIPTLFKVHSWYNLNITSEQFMFASVIFFSVSLILGIYRLLRTELQLRTFPWAWVLFMALLIFYVCGFFEGVPGLAAEHPAAWKKAVYLSVAYFLLLKGTFLSAFFTSKNIISYFRWFQCLKGSQYKRAFSLTPPWVITLLLTSLLILPLLIVQQRLEFVEHQGKMAASGFNLSLFFFLLRDLGILYYLTFDFQAKRAHIASLVYLLALYTLIPTLLSSTPLPSYWFPVFAPWAWFKQPEGITWTQLSIVVFFISVQAMVAWGLVVARWRCATRQLT